MKKWIFCVPLFLITFILVFIFETDTYAHPGRTDSSGGHTCRTNCASWGLETGEYHTHGGSSESNSSNDSSSESSTSSNSSASSDDSWDKDCTDFSSYDEIVDYWNSKGYSKTNDPEKLDGWGNAVDDGIPCEEPSGYDTAKINGSPAQIAEKAAVQDKTNGEKAGYTAGLGAGKKGVTSDSTSKGSAAYQEGYTIGYDEGYQNGSEVLEKQKITANKEGYALGKKQDKLVVPQQYASINSLKSSFNEGFNKAIEEKDEEKKKDYIALGFKDGKADIMNEPKSVKPIFIDAYKQGYDQGQSELKKTYVKQGYDAVFKNVKYKTPKLKSQKYINWYKEGFKSNNKVKAIQDAAYNAGLNGDDYIVKAKYKHAEPIYKYYFEQGDQERKEKNAASSGVVAAGVLGWVGRRFYVAKKMLK
ncbi:YHYH domain-containing protein [Peribacillus sp. FSL M8-0224]|uniref:YHYH domain-containing protein n=1 Tax=Peribacillus sp. FSL M8-0224 TaxID=2921568 RepID=UPI0030FBF604